MSLKGDKYESIEEIRLRLEGSIVMYDGNPVYITRCGNLRPNPFGDDDNDEGEGALNKKKNDITRVFFVNLPHVERDGLLRKGERNNKEVRKYLSSKNFDLSSFKMGFINHENSVAYLKRSPIRQYKQGLTSKTVKILPIDNKVGRVSFATLLHSQGFVDCINGKYPDFEEATQLLQEGRAAVAVSRNFALQHDEDLDVLYMNHKTVRCGIAMPGDKKIQLPDKFHFLKESMEEVRIPIA